MIGLQAKKHRYTLTHRQCDYVWWCSSTSSLYSFLSTTHTRRRDSKERRNGRRKIFVNRCRHSKEEIKIKQSTTRSSARKIGGRKENGGDDGGDEHGPKMIRSLFSERFPLVLRRVGMFLGVIIVLAIPSVWVQGYWDEK